MVSHALEPPTASHRRDIRLAEVIRALPAAIYTTDAVGRITFYNEAAAELWGCRPELGKSEFCGSWKLYWPDGTPLPHGECPMALALKEQRAIRGMEAVAERPDGTRVPFIPYPTPLFDDSGILVGAVNMLIDNSDQKRADVDASGLHQLSIYRTTRLSARTSMELLPVGIEVPSDYSAIWRKRSSENQSQSLCLRTAWMRNRKSLSASSEANGLINTIPSAAARMEV